MRRHVVYRGMRMAVSDVVGPYVNGAGDGRDFEGRFERLVRLVGRIVGTQSAAMSPPEIAELLGVPDRYVNDDEDTAQTRARRPVPPGVAPMAEDHLGYQSIRIGNQTLTFRKTPGVLVVDDFETDGDEIVKFGRLEIVPPMGFFARFRRAWRFLRRGF